MATLSDMDAELRLLRRRESTRKSRARRRAPTLPVRVETAYGAAVAALAGRIHRAIMEELEPLLRDAARSDSLEARTDQIDLNRLAVVVQQIAVRVADVIDTDEIENVVRDALTATATHATNEVAKLIRIPLSGALTPELQTTLQDLIVQNVGMITRMAQRQTEEILGIVNASVTQGAPVRDLQITLESRLGISRRRANLIARDQVLTANAQVTELRQVQAGITQYRWVSTGPPPGGDGRVRERHLELGNGTDSPDTGNVYSWDDPPRVTPDNARVTRFAHPGQDFQCRCTAVPVIAQFEGI
jgi:SPP1 gp7 family putative phage head morphogenesis protein